MRTSSRAPNVHSEQEILAIAHFRLKEEFGPKLGLRV